MAMATIAKMENRLDKVTFMPRKHRRRVKCPPTRYTTENDAYKMIGTSVPLFQSINEMPIKFDPAHLDEGLGIQETFQANNAEYHQTSRKI